MKNKITKEDIDLILAKTYIKVEQYGDKTTVLMATLPNGFVIVESSSCVDPANFDMKIGEQICMQKLEDKIWELEGYKLQSKLSEEQNYNIGFGIKIEQTPNEIKFIISNEEVEELI